MDLLFAFYGDRSRLLLQARSASEWTKRYASPLAGALAGPLAGPLASPLASPLAGASSLYSFTASERRFLSEIDHRDRRNEFVRRIRLQQQRSPMNYGSLLIGCGDSKCWSSSQLQSN